MFTLKKALTLPLMIAGLVGASQLITGCTIFEGCASYYGQAQAGREWLTEACSRGISFRTRSARLLAETSCRSNFLTSEARLACLHGIDLFERNAAGPVLHQGLN